MEKHEVKVHIDQKQYSSPNPTTGVDLYELAHVRENLVLYKEIEGDHEDSVVRIDATQVHLKDNEHFHTGRPPEHYYVIRINTEPVVLKHDHVSFDELTKLAFPNPPAGQFPEFTVTFEHAASHPHEGTLKAGGHVTVKKHGTTFDVTHTNRS